MTTSHWRISGMTGRSRWNGAAALTLATAGVMLLGAAAVVLVRLLPDILGADGEHMAGDAGLFALSVVVPLSIGGLIALLAAGDLWHGSRDGIWLGLLWVGLAGVACAVAAAGSGNLLSALRVIVLESGSWSLAWPTLGVAGGDGATYYGRLDDATFWIPAIVAVGVVAGACFLLGALASDQGRGR
jgi:hypothetical protein